MRAANVDVDVPEKIFLHEKPVGLRMLGRQPDIFVKVEGGDAAEIEPVIAMQPNQLLIKAEGRAASGQPEDGIRLFADDAGNNLGAEHAAGLGRIANKDFHGEEEACARVFNVSIPESGTHIRLRNPASGVSIWRAQSSTWP